MGKKATRIAAKKKTTEVDSAVLESADGVRSAEKTRREEPAGDFMEVAQEVVPLDEAAVHLPRTYRNHRTHCPLVGNSSHDQEQSYLPCQ